MNKPPYEFYKEMNTPLVATKEQKQGSFIFWAYIVGVGVICLFSSCQMTPARAEEITLKASWYSTQSLRKEGTYAYSHGIMANGGVFRDDRLTCANRLYPLGSMLRITNLASGKSVIVETTDRIGKRFARTRCDLSKGAFSQIARLEQGVISVKIERLS
jgi:rare lipoprotein A (peptidoglycan hydrolase)